MTRRIARWVSSCFFAGLIIGWLLVQIVDELDTTTWPVTP